MCSEGALEHQGRSGTLPPHAVAGPVERGREAAEATLAGREGDDPSTDAALARQADVVQPVPGRLVQPCRGHRRQHRPAHRQDGDPGAGHRVHTPVGQCRPHQRQVHGGHVKAALTGVQLDRLVWVGVERAEVVQEPPDRPVATAER